MFHCPKCKTVKFLDKNIGENLCNLELGKGVLDMTPKALSRKEKIENLDFTKI